MWCRCMLLGQLHDTAMTSALESTAADIVEWLSAAGIRVTAAAEELLVVMLTGLDALSIEEVHSAACAVCQLLGLQGAGEELAKQLR